MILIQDQKVGSEGKFQRLCTGKGADVMMGPRGIVNKRDLLRNWSQEMDTNG